MICFQKFIDYVGELLQAYVDRREQVKSCVHINIIREFCYILCQQTTGVCMSVLLDLHCVRWIIMKQRGSYGTHKEQSIKCIEFCLRLTTWFAYFDDHDVYLSSLN
jgi:hypothetical protein